MAVVIRDVERFSEYEECVRLQLEVWGFDELHVVPVMQLVAEHEYGGVCIGAFDEDEMVGFVYGFTGWDGTRGFHHSHMLAVLPDYRGRGLGEKLKWAQRERVLDKGLSLVNWTFDPLQAPNANLNINRLGRNRLPFMRPVFDSSRTNPRRPCFGRHGAVRALHRPQRRAISSRLASSFVA